MEIPEPDHQFKVPVVRRSEYTLFLEQATTRHAFIHCDIHVRWSPAVKAQLAEDFAALKALHGGPFLALHDPCDRKHHKFLRLFGFTWAASFLDRLGRRTEIYATH